MSVPNVSRPWAERGDEDKMVKFVQLRNRSRRGENWLAVIAILGVLAVKQQGAVALSVQLGSGQHECVYETLDEEALLPGEQRESTPVDVHVGMSVSKPGSHRRPRVHATVTEPDGSTVWSNDRLKAEEEAVFSAKGTGTYSLCFTNNEVGLDASKAIIDIDYFMPHHKMMQSNKRDVKGPAGRPQAREKTVANTESMDESHAYALNLVDDIKLLTQEQSHLMKRQRRHMRTLRSNRMRTLIWTGVEALGICVAAVAHVLLVRYLCVCSFSSW